MQTLGISDSVQRNESRLKSLFWPSIESGVDVEYLAIQGYWVCTIVAVLSLGTLLVAHQPILGVAAFFYFQLGAIGVREHSRIAALVVFVFYFVDTLLSFQLFLASPAMIVIRVIIIALLLSNLRATWIASHWQSGSENAALPIRLSDTFMDKLANNWLAGVWPKARVAYYIFSTGVLLLLMWGIVLRLSRG